MRPEDLSPNQAATLATAEALHALYEVQSMAGAFCYGLNVVGREGRGLGMGSDGCVRLLLLEEQEHVYMGWLADLHLKPEKSHVSNHARDGPNNDFRLRVVMMSR